MEELRSLVIGAQGGNLDAYGQIVRRFQDMAYGYAYSILSDFHLAEDAAQEAFIEAYRCLSGLDDPSAFPGWFRRIVFKQCDRLTRRKRVPTTPLASARPIASGGPGPVEKVEKREMADRVLEAIRSLPEDERTVTTLYYVNGYSQEEVAEFLEVPVTTVNNRLHASRKRLKERMMTMVAKTLKEHALPGGFPEMIKRLVLFPQKEPEIGISRAERRRGSVTFREAFFAPLKEGATAWLADYDWPKRKLAGTNCIRVIGKAKVGGLSCYRIRSPEFDPERQFAYDHEWYWAATGRKLYFVAFANFEPGTNKPRLRTWKDSDWDEDRTGWPIELKLRSRIRWDSLTCGRGPLFPRMPVVGGLWNVRIGGSTYECLRTLNLGYKGRREGKTPAELAGKYELLSDSYINMSGRTVLFRRYNGPAWKAKNWPSTSVKKLAGKGCPELRYNGVEFRLWYDCIPLHALRPENGTGT